MPEDNKEPPVVMMVEAIPNDTSVDALNAMKNTGRLEVIPNATPGPGEPKGQTHMRLRWPFEEFFAKIKPRPLEE